MEIKEDMKIAININVVSKLFLLQWKKKWNTECLREDLGWVKLL